MNIRIISLSCQASRIAIFMVEEPSANSVKIVLLENLAPYSIFAWYLMVVRQEPQEHDCRIHQQYRYIVQADQNA